MRVEPRAVMAEAFVVDRDGQCVAFELGAGGLADIVEYGRAREAFGRFSMLLASLVRRRLFHS